MPIAHLDDRAVIRIAGADATTLLQNVVTLDMAAVDRHGSGYGALLTPQGKILWDFVLHRLADGYAADVRADQAEQFAKRLSLYRLRAKVEIAVAPDLTVLVGWSNETNVLALEETGEAPNDPRLAKLGWRRVAPAASARTNAAATDWHRHRIALAIPEGGVDFVFGDTFPHDAGMDSLNGIAFDKGCYVGQEVVSRMRHRGTARKRIVALTSEAPFPMPGTEILAGERPIGRLGSSAGNQAIGLVRLDRLRAALDEGATVVAGSTVMSAFLPDWATYGWPALATAGAD